jgi:Domain of unknown function (DUF5666)
MIRKILFGGSLLGLMTLGMATRVQSVHAQDTAKQTEPATKSISGKVTAIGNSGTSFSLTPEGSSKDTIEFTVNTSTQVKGQLKVGTMVAVEYQPAANGQNLAVSVTARS